MKQLLSSTNSGFRTQTLKSPPTSCFLYDNDISKKSIIFLYFFINKNSVILNEQSMSKAVRLIFRNKSSDKITEMVRICDAINILIQEMLSLIQFFSPIFASSLMSTFSRSSHWKCSIKKVLLCAFIKKRYSENLVDIYVQNL